MFRPLGTTVDALNFVNRHFKPLLKCAGPDDIRWHDIGHTCAELLLGHRYWFAGAIYHTGRRSGREYTTPVWAVPTPDGFLISLPFGEGVDWLKNVLAAGRATIETRGEL